MMERVVVVRVTIENKRGVALCAINERTTQNKLIKGFVDVFLGNLDDERYYKKYKDNKYDATVILQTTNAKRFKLKKICRNRGLTLQELMNNIILVGLSESGGYLDDND